MKGSGAAGNSFRAAPRSPPCESGAATSRGSMAVALTLLALLIELAVGYPDRLVRAIGHPVTWIGRLIDTLDRAWNRDAASDPARRVRGALAVALIVATAGAAGYGLQRGLSALPYGIVAAALCASSLIAQRSLHDHVARVATALERDSLTAARAAVAAIVGRDTAALDEGGVARAAVESLAENFSDGVVAPVFWMALAGLPGAAVYKAINTADSMIGHRTPRHRAFGCAAARLDDLVNLPASRLSGLLLALAALLPPRGDPAAAFRAMRRDARFHRSPNAGWPEAAIAGALGFALNGPRAYGGVMSADGWMNRDGRAALAPADIDAALALYRRACALLFALVVGAA